MRRTFGGAFRAPTARMLRPYDNVERVAHTLGLPSALARKLFQEIIAHSVTVQGNTLSGREEGREVAVALQAWPHTYDHLAAEKFLAGMGAQFAFPVLTLRMLDLFPAARGTAASAQSFVALLVTAFTLGIVSVKVLARLEWLAWASIAYTCLAALCWYLSRRWHEKGIVAAVETTTP